MRKQISVTNKKVIEIFKKQKNVSKYIETCVLSYEDFREHDYITREELAEILQAYRLEVATEEKIKKVDLDGIFDF